MSIKDTDFDGCRFSMKTNFKDQRSLPPLGDTLTERNEKDLNEQFDINLMVE